MKLNITAIALLFATVCSMSSCLESDYETTTYDDTAITSITLGSLKCYLHTTSSKGVDSVYAVSVSSNNYPVYIDQLNNEIYNVDSLPKGTDLKHVVITVNTKNSSVAMLRSVTGDSVSLITNTDSLDFSVPRHIYCVANSGKCYRDYTMKLVAHQEEADSFAWKNVAVSSRIAAFEAVKSVTFKKNLYVLGTIGSKADIVRSAIADGVNWNTVATPAELSAAASLVAGKNSLFLLDNETLYTSADGQNWSDMPAAGLKKLIGECASEMYALSNNGEMLVSTDNGATWNVDNLDVSANWLPSENISCIATIQKTNSDVSRAIMIGNRDANAYSSDTYAMVWSKIVDRDASTAQPWSYCHVDDINKKFLPCLENLSVTNYNNQLMAIGGKGVAGSDVKAFNQIYVSKDCGITWHSDSKFVYPEGFDGTVPCIVSDEDNYLWIISAGKGQVWKGRLSQLGWATQQKIFD